MQEREILWTPGYLPEGERRECYYSRDCSILEYPSRSFNSWYEQSLFVVSNRQEILILNVKDIKVPNRRTISRLTYQSIDIKSSQPTSYFEEDLSPGYYTHSHVYLAVESMDLEGSEPLSTTLYPVDFAMWLPEFRVDDSPITAKQIIENLVVVSSIMKYKPNTETYRAYLDTVFQYTDRDEKEFYRQLKLNNFIHQEE